MAPGSHLCLHGSNHSLHLLRLHRYETELEAARAYDRAVLAYVGTSAPLNVSFTFRPGV